MEDYKFSEFWENSVNPILIQLSSNYTLQEPVNKDSNARKDMESLYDCYRAEIKKNFMLQNDCRLDRHKVCACIYKAIAEKPILKVIEGSLEKDRLVNAQVAFVATCNVLFSFMQHGAKSEPDFEKFLNDRGALCFPERKNGDSNETYIVQTVKALCYAQRKNELSLALLANLFYLLEDKTCSCYEAQYAQHS